MPELAAMSRCSSSSIIVYAEADAHVRLYPVVQLVVYGAHHYVALVHAERTFYEP